ncbi:MAG: SUMF1/EgtB/PvdO family nonheme iron enzyme [Anaerolineales bacterium]|jgi:formylglycine-generating enzyme required for sulfatase activity|nr:SUMF1/EgtB/PvdO family nonheme iron enzyme [Anaerolineales bacterium]
MKQFILGLALLTLLLAGCAAPDLNAPIPTFETGIDPNTWAQVPAGEFLFGQHEAVETTAAFELMVTDVTVSQYTAWLTEALASGALRVGEFDGQKAIVGFYPGDQFRGIKHEEEIEAGDWIFIPLEPPASRFTFDGFTFAPKPGYENHPITNVTWFGAWAYCGALGGRLPTEVEWEKAARGTDGRPFPWGEQISRETANFYASRDPFEDMSSFGSRTSPVGFYNGKLYGTYQTASNASPYGIYDMAGNVWQWTGDVYEGMHYRFMRGGSKDTYDMDLRAWVRNNATPTYFSPGVGFRCLR